MFDQTYPPNQFCHKMGQLLAPRGQLLAPQVAVKQYQKIDPEGGQKVKNAFCVTLKKLTQLWQRCLVCDCQTEYTYGRLTGKCQQCHVTCCSTACLDHVTISHDSLCNNLSNQKVDQVGSGQFVECFPAPLNIFALFDKKHYKPKKMRSIKCTWKKWFDSNQSVRGAIDEAAHIIALWKKFVQDDIQFLELATANTLQASLERLVSGIVSLPLTILHAIRSFGLAERKSIQIHLVGAAVPEVTMATSSLVRLVTLSLGRRSVGDLVLISPDHTVAQLAATTATVESPQSVDQGSVTAYHGLYHHFHTEHVTCERTVLGCDGKQGAAATTATTTTSAAVGRPDLVVCIHPGAHADELYTTWHETLQLFIASGYPVAMTTYNQQEFEGTLNKLARFNAKYVYKGENPFASMHVKQTPADKTLLWSNNSHLILFRGSEECGCNV